MKVKVIFEYDEMLRKWEVLVQGATSELDALQAFNAVVITANMATPKVDHNKAVLTTNSNEYKISVGL